MLAALFRLLPGNWPPVKAKDVAGVKMREASTPARQKITVIELGDIPRDT